MASIQRRTSSPPLSAVACGLLALLAAAPAASQPITFSVAGDHPYEEDEIPEFQQHMDLHNLYSPSEFLVHVGDIKASAGPCMQVRYDTVAAALRTLAVPAFMIPGDNEWTDCANPDSAWTWWENAFLDMELDFCSTFPVERQAIRRENFAFVRSGVLFVGINIPNGSADDQDQRLNDNAAWVDHQFLDKGPQVRAAVVFGHAGRSSSRDLFFDQFRVSAVAFGKPVLYAMGDEHEWDHDDPWLEPNIQRMVIEEGGSETPVQVTVTTDSVAVFQFVRDPLASATVPFNWGPCIDAGPHQIIDEVDVLSLTPEISDDGVTGPGGLTATWSKVSGAGSVVFGDPNQATTTAVFTAPDLYVLRLEVDDGDFVVSDDLTVDVLGFGAPARLTIDDVTVVEGNTGSRSASFTVTRGGAFGEWVGVSYATANGSATAPADFTATSGTLAFAPYALTKTVVVSVRTDSVWEPDETFFMNLSNATNGANIAKPQGVGTILNDDILYHDLTVTAGAPGWVTLDPPIGPYADGSTVTLTAEFPAGWALGAWSGALTGDTNPVTLVMDAPKSVHATFVPNAAPVAVADGFSVDEDVLLSIAPPGLLGNDSDPDLDPLAALPGVAPAHGTLGLAPDGSFTYTPDANFWGPDSFTYVATDGRGAYDSASVAITVFPVDDAPIGGADAYTTPEATTLIVGAPGVLENDTDLEGSPITAVPATPPGNGSLTLSPDGSFTYVPSVALVGRDWFTYRVSDGALTSDEIEVEITAGGPAPFTFIPTDDSYTRSSNPDTDYGSAEELRVRGGTPSYSPYFKFAPSGIGEIVGATLRLYVADDGDDGGTLFETSLDFAGTSIPWTEDELHSGNAPPFTGPPLGSAGPVDNGEWVEWDVSTLVNEVGPVSFGLTSVEPHSVRYSSKEGSKPPQLVMHAFRGVPDVTAVPASHDYGDVRIPGSATTTIEVRNDGTADLAVGGATLVGAHATDFAIVTGGGSFGLGPGESRLLEISFQPPLPGVRTAALRLTTDDPDELTVDVALGGHAIEPEIAAVPASHDWGDVRLATPVTRSLEIRNEGAAALVVGSTTLAGPNAADFAIVSGGGSFTLAPGAAHALELGFQTAVLGDRAAFLRVASDDRDENPLDVPLAARGVEPEIDVTPSGHAFGDVLVGTVSAAVAEIRNVGTTDLAVTSLSLVGTDVAEFGFGAPGESLTIAPGDTARIDVTFEPAGTGPKTAALRIVSDDLDEGVVDVALTGTGVVPDVTLTPPSQDWGDVRVAATAARSFEVRNDGGSLLTVSATTLEGSDAGEFGVTAGGGPFALAPGETRSIEVTLAPTRSGPVAAMLRIASDDPDEGAAGVALSGTAVEPDIALAESSWDWGEVRLGTTPARGFEVRNDGTAALAVTATTLVGSDAAELAIVAGGGAFTVAAGGSHVIEVSFTPVTSGPKSALLRVTSDDLDEGTAEVALAGTGIEPEIAVGQPGHDHGDVRVGTTSTRTFDLYNEGTAVLLVSAVNVEGPDAAEFFVAAGGGSFALEPGAERPVDVGFLPAGTGPRNATLRIESDDADEGSLPLFLAGTGVEPDIATDPAQAWSDVRTGASQSLPIEVQNVGTSELALGAATLEGPDAGEFAIVAGGAGVPIAAGASHTIDVSFQPTTPGPKSASLRLPSDDPDEGVVTVALGGTAIEPDVALDATGHDWGDVRVATTQAHAFELRNDGTADLAVATTTLEGPEAVDWAIAAGGGSFVVAPGGTRTVTLELTPSSAGLKSASLRIETDDPDESSVVIDLVGRGIEPQVAVTPAAHDWGDVRVAALSTRTIEVRNEGTADLAVGAPSVEGANAAEFTFAPVGAFVVAPGGAVSLDVTFQPAATGARSAILRIPSDDADQAVVDVTLGGSGVEADIDPDPARDWGDVRVGTTVTAPVSLRNVGTFELAVSATELEGPDAAAFALVAGGGSFVLAPGETRDLDVRFLPASPGAKNARVRVTSDDPDEGTVDIVLTGNAVAPEIAVTPLAHDWDDVRVGTAATFRFEVRNDGTADLVVSAAGVQGQGADEFVVVRGGAGFSVAPGESRDVDVEFAPSAVGARVATLRITSDDDDESTIDASLSGTGVEPDIGTDAGYDWGDVRTGTVATHSFEIRNDGTSDLAVTGASVEGADAAAFAVTAGAGGFTVAAGETHAIEVGFQPGTPGAKSAALRVFSDDPDESGVSVALAGAGIEPDIATDSTGRDWGDVRVATGAVHGFVVSNEGTADLLLSAVEVVGAEAADFAIVGGGGAATIAPGATHRIDVRFTPAAPGPRSATLRVTSDDPDEAAVDLSLTGRGVEPEITVSPGSRDWGEVRVGTSTSLAFEVRNDGEADLVVVGASIEGADAAEFGVVAGGSGFTVGPGASHTVEVSFGPTSVGIKAAALRIASDDADEGAALFGLAGTGVEPDIAAGAGHDWGDVRVGVATPAVLLLRNDGTGDLTVSGTGLVGADSAVFSIEAGGGGFVVAAGGTHAIDLSVTPAAGGPKSAVLRVTSDDPDEGVLDVPLAANAVEPRIEVSPPSRDYGEAGIGVAVTQLFSIHNAGSADLAVASTAIVGPDAADFSIVSGGGELTAAPGVTHYVALTFRPTAVGPREATLVIVSDDAARPVVLVPLTGTGVAPDITVGADHDFGDVRVGTPVSHAIDVGNAGNTNLAVTAVEFVGPDAAAFAVTAGGGAFGLAPGATRTIHVRWSAATAGPSVAALRLTSNDPDEGMVEIVFTGRAVEPDIAVSPANHDFGQILVGGGSPERTGRAQPVSGIAPTEVPEIEVMVSNEGTAPLLVSGVTLEGVGASSFEIVGGTREATIGPGETIGITVRATVATLGAKSAVLRIASDDDDENPFEVELAVKGVRFLAPTGEGGAPETDRGGESLATSSGLPTTFSVGSVYPNPCAGAASIEYAVPARSDVNIVVYDTAGRRVRRIAAGPREAGFHRARWDGRDDFGRTAGSGIYFVRLEAAGESRIVKLILRR